MSERMADERRELEEAGWESRGDGATAIWRRSKGGSWYAHYHALATLRAERFEQRVSEGVTERAREEASNGEEPTMSGGGAA